MSIFKETFKDFIFKQLRIREAIIEQGNDPTKFRHRFGKPRNKINVKNKIESINIDAGAFYTNTVHKQCVIRMLSGVDIVSSEVLESSEKNLLNENLAKTYILEGGILDEKGNQRSGFAGKPNSAYGDKSIRSNAVDGFGIVPMPGIIDADIRTKTAYGSLREAKVNFVCHNRRQLEVLELLYMRPGFPILLEWQWSPFINNKGKIDNQIYGIKDDWFDSTKTTNDFNLSIIKNKKLSGGNYDGFVGFCKNFEMTSRSDGGYDCTTELIATGEVLEGLKSRNDGYSKNEENKNVQIDNMQMILEGLTEIGEKLSLKSFKNSNVTLNLDSETLGGQLLDTLAGTSTRSSNNLEGNDPETIKLRNEILLEQKARFTSFLKKYDEYYLFKGEELGVKEYFWSNDEKLKSRHSFVRWDHLCDLINQFVFPLPNPDDPDNPLLSLTYTQPKNGEYMEDKDIKAGWIFKDDNEKYIEFNPYEFPGLKLSRVDNEYGIYREVEDFYKSKLESKINVEDILNNSFDPKICLLPVQNKKSFNASNDNDKRIGYIMLNLDYLKTTYNQMAYNSEGPKEDFNLFDYFKKIWESVNKACVGNHNFVLQTELERPNRVRIIDLQVSPPENINPGDLFEFKIQSNASIVRDFNYNTTIPNSLSATIAIAAQAPSSVSDLDQVTFSNFSKGIKSRFASSSPTSKSKVNSSKKSKKSNKEIYDEDLQKYRENVVDLAVFLAHLLKGDYDDSTSIDDKSFSEATSLASGIQKQITTLLKRDDTTGEPKPIIPSKLSAVIPIKFNASIDGIGGIVIGHVFKVEKEKLPKGYQSDDVAFTVLGESQKITAGQDWITEISGQLMLLDLGEDERKNQQNKFSNQSFDLTDLKIENISSRQDNTRVVLTPVQDEIVTLPELSNEDISEFFPNATVTEGDASLGNENEE